MALNEKGSGRWLGINHRDAFVRHFRPALDPDVMTTGMTRRKGRRTGAAG